MGIIFFRAKSGNIYQYCIKNTHPLWTSNVTIRNLSYEYTWNIQQNICIKMANKAFLVTVLKIHQNVHQGRDRLNKNGTSI